MHKIIVTQEAEYQFEESDVCMVKDLWHDVYHQKEDLPDPRYGLVIPCLVRRWKIDNQKLETVLDHYYIKAKTFENTPIERVKSWCYIDDLEPNTEEDNKKFNIKNKGRYFYSTIDIKDNFDDFFHKLNKNSIEYQAIYKTFKDYEDELIYIGEASIPIEDLRWWGFHNRLHLYIVRFSNNGQTILVSSNRLILELAIGIDNKTKLLKI